MTIKVQGETYADEAEVVDAIGALTAEYLTMPEGQKRANLLTHIERLRSAVDEPLAPIVDKTSDDEPTLPRRDSAAKIQEPSDDTDNDEDEIPENAEPVCPMCNGAGVLAVEPPLHPLYEQCADCEGYGLIYTGSRREGRAVEDCPTCNGDGFKRKAPQIAALPIANLTRAESAQAPGATLSEDGQRWLAPPYSEPPWAGATWDEFYGAWR